METIKIKQSELEKLLSNEDTIDSTLEKYFDYEFNQPFSADYKLKPNVEVIYELPSDGSGVTEKGLAEFMMKTANSMSRRKRRRRYRKMLRENPDAIRIVSEGDSWFQHPHPKVKDTIDHLSERFAIYSVGAAGDELKNMYRENEYLDAIKEVDPTFFLLSGGGNDILGAQFRHYLKKDFAKAEIGQNPRRFLKNVFFLELERIGMIYQNILEGLTEMKPDMHILLHGYDYVIPESKTNTGWLGRYMIGNGIKEHDDRQALVNLIIDEFNQKITQTASQFDNVTFIDVRTRVANDRWYDEIHPDSEGFKTVADCFNEKMEGALKRGTS